MRNIKVVIFDCDGVLFDTSDANKAYYNRILNHFGKPDITAEQFVYIHMHTVDESLTYLLANDREIEAAHRFRKGLNYSPFFKCMRIEPDLKPLLEKLRPVFRVAIATNRSDTILPLLAEFELGDDFDMVVSSLDVKRPKPFPDPLLKILDFFRIGADQAVYVGDSKLDETASMSAGIPLVAYRNRALEAAYHINHLNELEKIIGI